MKRLADWIEAFAAVERATAILIASTIVLAIGVSVPIITWKLAVNVWQAQPGWLKWLVAHLG